MIVGESAISQFDLLLNFFQDSDQIYPSIEMKGGDNLLHASSYSISADDTEVIPVVIGDLISATTTLFAIYWTYGFDYPRKIQRTFAFLETYVFQLGKSKTFCLPALRLKTDVDSM